MNWYVLYVKSRYEKQVAERLQRINIEVYCPLIKETKQWSDRKKTVETPLFKSYVFVRLAPKDRQVVFEVSGVVRYLFWLGKPAIARDKEIDVIKMWLEDDSIEEIEMAQMVPGQEILIEKGMFKDKRAVVKEVGKKRLRLILKDLGIVVNAKIIEVV